MTDDALIGRYSTGELIFREGDPGTFACLVRSGLVELYHPRGTGNIQIATVKPGQLFGELALFDGGPRMAAARALTTVEVHRIDREKFVAELDALDETTRYIMNELLTFVRETDPYNANERTSVTPEMAERIREMREFLRGVAFGRTLSQSPNPSTRTLGELLVFYAERRIPPEQ
ncbi:MAG: cyclic nucleotide-binding domain-containing protein [Rhodospirillales bacterium]|nr:cyclic nucleotide-binding domain-containing protein [Rhodospirillales bacterium]